MARVDEEFSAQGILRGRTIRFRADDALAVVRRCQERGVKVLGVDGFIITEHFTQPLMEQSVDMSDFGNRHSGLNCWDRAAKFLEERKTTDLYFEVVMEDHK
ncbi:MAG TPA: hypothetical protein VG056_02365 [Pirellulales bacterium]|jgi:hypothetical protein|nr:hypothetical protein [Pirellulales bacterium]